MQKNYKSTRILSLENNKDFLVSFSKGKGVIYQAKCYILSTY